MVENYRQIELFEQIEQGRYTNFLGWSEKAQWANYRAHYAILNKNMANISENNTQQPLPYEGNNAENLSKQDSYPLVTLDKDKQSLSISLPTFSRRTFLKAGGVVAASVLATVIAKNAGIIPTTHAENSNPTPAPTESIEPAASKEAVISNGKIVVEGVDKEEFFGDKERFHWMPDGHISYFTTSEGKRRFFLSGGAENASFMLEIDASQTLKQAMESDEGNMIQVFGPDENVQHRKHYAGITSSVKVGNKRYAVYHGEERVDPSASGNYTATVGMAVSEDEGKTWSDMGPLIVGDEVLPPGQAPDGGPTGAGQPCIVYNDKDGYVHGMYIDWSANTKIMHPDQLYKFRMKANQDGSLGQVEYLTTDGYSSTFEPEKLKSVIPAGEIGYTALPSISYNEKLGKWLTVGLSANGFWQSTSDDLDNWSKPEIIYDYNNYGAQHGDAPMGGRWIYYPSVLSENMDSSEKTDENGILYHSLSENFGFDPHFPVAVNYQVQSN